MDPTDHHQTASWGSSTAAKKYRAYQRKLILNGQYDEAFQLDINDVQAKFGDKYDNVILEAIDAIP